MGVEATRTVEVKIKELLLEGVMIEGERQEEGRI